MIGRSLSHYSVMDSIGAGGMGVVYRARDAHLERDVALKVLPADTLADDAARRRFRKEALALSTLNHPNIATVFDFDTQDGVDFLVMELVPGESLRDRLKSGPLAIEEAARLGRQLLEGLSAAHARGVVHRDLKPENVRVTPEGRLKVLDFGLATLVGPVDESATTRTVSELGLKGTVPYMAPEQLRGQAVDARTDLFAAGAVLYEMVTGSRPFAQKAGPALIEAILHAEPPAPRSLNPAIPEGLEAVLLKSLEKDPKGRYQSAAEFLRDLDEAAQGEMPVVPPRPWRRALWIAAAAVTATLGTLAGVGIHRVFFATAPIDSLAVLPFENQDANPDAEYLSDGIAESIINNVSQIRGVRVIARTSAFRYKGRHVEPKRAARELSVRAVLTGYVQRRGDDLVVSAELVDTENDRHLWGQRYTSRFSEILAVEENIAARISDELRLRLTAEEGERLAKRRTVRPEAYDLYLKGRHDVATGTPESLRQAVRFFEESLKVDPDFALAHAGMAEALYFSSGLIMSPRDAMPRVRDEARNALRLDTDLAEAHAILAMVDAFYDRDWESGEAGLRRALALNPGYSPAHIWYGLLLTAQGRAREALEEMKRATEIDPLSSTSTWYAIFPYLWAPREERQLDQAAAAARAILSRDPDFYFAYNTLAVVNQLRGLHDEAIRNLEAAVASVGETTDFELLYLGHAYAIAGRKDEARRIWTQVSSLTTDVYRSAFARAILQFGLGDRDSGFAWLERAYEDRQEDLALLNVDPRFDDLHDDPRFQSLRRRLRLEPGAHEPVAGAP